MKLPGAKEAVIDVRKRTDCRFKTAWIHSPFARRVS